MPLRMFSSNRVQRVYNIHKFKNSKPKQSQALFLLKLSQYWVINRTNGDR